MRTHENSDPTDVKGLVEFCFDDRYYQFNESYSTSYTNADSFQAWRAGFREGVKMSLDQGAKADNLKNIWWQNYHRLLVWCSVGTDVEHGIWSILGAREGCYMTMCTDWDYSQVRDFEWLTNYWMDTHVHDEPGKTTAYINFLAKELKEKCGLEIANLDAAGSKFFKTVYTNTPRIIRKR
jgi:hypothetical protein